MHIRKGNDMEDELFEQSARVIRAGNEAVMTGIELGREESAARIKELETTNAKLLETLKGIVAWAERNICTHEDTHRGGTLWEICDRCGAMWADDKGGKPVFAYPQDVFQAMKAIKEAEE